MKRFSKLINDNINNNIIETKQDNINNKPNGFCILKPGFVDEYEKQFCDLLTKAGWNIINKKRTVLTPDQASTLYINLEEKPFYTDLCDYMSSDDCLCVSCYKDINKCKDNDPICDMKELKDTVRSQWSKDEMKNAMHSSDSLDNVVRETTICFNECNNIKEDESECIIGTYSRKDELQKQLDITNDRCRYKQYNIEMSDDIFIFDDTLRSKLQRAIAEEIQAGYFYLITQNFITGYERTELTRHFTEYSHEEIFEHARQLLNRLNELNCGVGILYDFNSINTLCQDNGHSWSFNGSMNSIDLIQTAINFEIGSIDTYKDLEYFTRGIDTTTNDLIKHLLKDEIKHLTELREIQKSLGQMTWDNL